MYDLDWDESNVDHIARHGVEPEEVEEVLLHTPLIRRSRDGRYVAFGRSDSGRYLTVVFERRSGSLRVVTARAMAAAERADFRRHRP